MINILVVTSLNSGSVHPFIKEQVETISNKFEVHYDYFFIKRKGIIGYLKETRRLKNYLKASSTKFDLIHSHYGLSGMTAIFQTSIKKIVTFHGSDINYIPHRLISQLVIFFTDYSIFVTNNLKEKVLKRDHLVIPCGINTDVKPLSKSEARTELGWEKDSIKILFASNFKRPEKNPDLAIEVVNTLKDKYKDIELIELSGFSREGVNIRMCACDALLLTSSREGSPQVIKEALYFRLPIVATDVGVIRDILKDTDQTYICTFQKEDLAQALEKVIKNGMRIKDNSNFNKYDNNLIANDVYQVYLKVMSK